MEFCECWEAATSTASEAAPQSPHPSDWPHCDTEAGNIDTPYRGVQWRDQSSASRFLHERVDPCLFGGSQVLQREGDGPHGTFVEVRLVAEAERRVPRLEFVRALEEADDIAVLGVRGHPVPGSRREGWRAGFDDGMEPLGHGPIRFRHLGDLREQVAFPTRLLRARAAVRFRLQLLGTLLHRGAFLVRESLDHLAGDGRALGALLRFLLWAHRNILILTWVGPSPQFEWRTRAIIIGAA